MITIRLKCFSQVKYALGKNEITLIPEQKTSADDQGDKEDESKVD